MRLTIVIASTLLASCATTHAPDQVPDATGVIDRVFRAFNECQIESLLGHYSDRSLVFFTPETPAPLRTHAQLREYFADLASTACADPGMPKHTDIRLTSQEVAQTVTVVHANTVVAVSDKGTSYRLPFYFTFVLARESGRWSVVSQDAHRIQSK